MIDIDLPDFFKSSTVLLFELLDFNPTLILTNQKKTNHEYFYQVAWGYLRPLGVSQVHLASTKVQLYRYKGIHNQRNKYRHLDVFDGRHPDVLLELAWPCKSKYPSFLEVEINFH